jgi:hypothetical protein
MEGHRDCAETIALAALDLLNNSEKGKLFQDKFKGLKEKGGQ